MALANNKYQQRLDSIKKGVIRQFGKGKSKDWRNRDFEELSFEIHKSSKQLISTATLKRIFGKHKTSDTYYPQDATLEALEQYAGSDVTHEFDTKKWLLAGAPILLLLVVFVVMLLRSYHKERTDAPKATLALSKIEGHTPATAFFNYNIPAAKDSVFISFGDGHPPRYLAPGAKMISHVYNYPGLFKVALQTRNKQVSPTQNVLVTTKGWQALAYYFEQDFRDRYYPVPMDMAKDSGSFHPSSKILSGMGMDTTKIVVLRLDNFKPSQEPGDAFKLKTRLRNINYWPAIRCYSAYLFVVGEKGQIIFKLTNEGCSGHAEYTLSEKAGYGTSSDLTALTLNIKDWNQVEVVNENKTVKLLLNGQNVFTSTYARSIGNIVGTSLQFHGSGFVDYIELYGKDQQVVFSNDF